MHDGFSDCAVREDGSVLAALGVTVPEGAQRVLSRIGRTEDVRFSPDNKRLAVAGFGHDAIYVFDVDVGGVDDEVTVALRGVTELLCTGLSQPHGLAFLGDSTLIVANRAGEAVIVGIPQTVPGVRSVQAAPLATIADDDSGVSTPGSVAATRVAADLFEVLVCNNYVHRVTRHLVDLRDGCRVLGAEVVAASGLQIPDGVAVSRDRRWVAISNHLTHSVAIYDRVQRLAPDASPTGVLCNVNHPHGLAFSGDDGHLVVAAAGSPYCTSSPGVRTTGPAGANRSPPCARWTTTRSCAVATTPRRVDRRASMSTGPAGSWP